MVFGEPGSGRAVELRQRFPAGSLSLSYAELSLFKIANALLFGGKFYANEIAHATAAIVALTMRRLGFEQDALNDAALLAGQNGVAIYDSYLVSLAARHHLTFLTADRKLLRRLSHLDIVRDFELHP